MTYEATQRHGANVHRCYLQAVHADHVCVCGRRWTDSTSNTSEETR